MKGLMSFSESSGNGYPVPGASTRPASSSATQGRSLPALARRGMSGSIPHAPARFQPRPPSPSAS